MAIVGGRPPEKGSVSAWLSFQVQRGASVNGWIAGPAVCVLCHVQRGSKPCLKRYTHKNASCDHCAKGIEQEFLYYLPWYREPDVRPCISIFHDDMRDALELSKRGQYVRIGRVDEDNRPHYLQFLLKDVPLITSDSAKKVAQDISDYLPVLWRMKGAVTGAMVRRGPLPAETGSVSIPEPRPDLADNVPEDHGKPLKLPPMLGEVALAALERNKAFVAANRMGGDAEPNGVHGKKKSR
jgi:hypothetical protein